MSFDTSRFTFNPWNDYSGVVMEQGRVQLDSDWNEWIAEISRRIQAGTLDILGRAVYPATTPSAFQIAASTDASGQNHITIGPGRMYVDGLLAENHGNKSAAEWDPALAELSGSPQPPSTSPTGTIDYTAQPYYPSAPFPTGNGPFLAYLDVWERPVNYLNDPNLVDTAVNVDTTGRVQTVWQVKLSPLAAGSTCSSAQSNPPWPGPSVGELSNDYVTSSPSGPCCLSSGTGYTGMENQFYRIEIHQPGSPAANNTFPAASGTATFKWSRDNASVETGVTAIANVTNSLGKSAVQLTVLSLGRDQVLGFAPGNWIEILDDDLELNGKAGELHLIDSIDFSSRTITLADPLQTPANFPVDGSSHTTPLRHTRIRRWDQSGKIYQAGPNPGETTLWIDLGAWGSTGDIPVPPPGTRLILESGITVAFGPTTNTAFNTGDFWNFAARASTGLIDRIEKAPPRGIHHHYAPLAIVSFSPPSNPDCRAKWPPSGHEPCGGCCCTCTVGDGVNSFGQYTSIQAAINALPAAGGEVCILPGRYYENIFLEGLHDVVIHGCGYETRVASLALKPGYTAPAQSGSGSQTTMNAVISIAHSWHIEMRSFAVEAAQGEAGILIDGIGTLIAPQPSNAGSTQTPRISRIDFREILVGAIDITIEDIVLTASTAPAIIAKRARLLKVRNSRAAMANVFSLFPAVWMSGDEIEFLHNWVGIQTPPNLRDWLPASVDDDLTADAKAAAPTGTSITGTSNIVRESVGIHHPGGLQIAGPSQDVAIAENQIAGGLRNGITLGNYTVIDKSGNETRYTAGLTLDLETTFTTTGSLSAPTTFINLQGSSIVAGDTLVNISIHRNSISNFGLCGIGPVGFFNLKETFEIIAIENLSIAANLITNTVQRATANDLSSFLAYGAICLPSVEGLTIRDNTITNFGSLPGLAVAGIFVLHGDTVEISRNQVIDNRDWANASTPDQAGNRTDTTAAVSLAIVSPPTLASDLKGINALAVFEPGLPALSVKENVVRVPMGAAIAALGFGPFAISANHFSCGGNIPGASSSALRCVNIINLGLAIELIPPSAPSYIYNQSVNFNPAINDSPSFVSSCGAVLFNNNRCQLELREVPQSSFASVSIVSFDDLIFSNNHCWLDAAGESVSVDAFLLAGTLQVSGNHSWISCAVLRLERRGGAR